MLNREDIVGAVCGFLEHNENLQKNIKGVFTAHPLETPFPYLVVQWDSVEIVHNKGLLCFSIDLYSAYKGSYEVQNIISLIEACLERSIVYNTKDAQWTFSFQCVDCKKIDANKPPKQHVAKLTYRSLVKEFFCKTSIGE